MSARITIEQGDPDAAIVQPPPSDPDKPMKPPKEKWKKVAEKFYGSYAEATRVFEEELGALSEIERTFAVRLDPALAVRIKPWFREDDIWHSHRERVIR
ncbi:hypothetical protein S7S_04290 [Isoalcanivorax pacificus W11-5]|jgi:hypothetical protein|uniref:Uncharacterized protein n=1 Tax=Isoalcanivorax pacificus W11-5 TaxID=391936 RepID=A0A0B4XKR9_9GAMM|nr:hypothetical protein [Isoalcanivorax pacificus]AJD47280.1 hypothetical protein S7S_04290 [Isoalcanivorax pacificus W11-5]